MRASKKHRTREELDLLKEIRDEYTVAEYNYLLEGTPESLVKYRQARAYFSYVDNIKVGTNVS